MPPKLYHRRPALHCLGFITFSTNTHNASDTVLASFSPDNAIELVERRGSRRHRDNTRRFGVDRPTVQVIDRPTPPSPKVRRKSHSVIHSNHGEVSYMQPDTSRLRKPDRKSRYPRQRKLNRGPRHPRQRGVSVRTLLVLDWASRMAAIDAGLMLAMHKPWELIVASAVAAWVATFRFLDEEVKDLAVLMLCLAAAACIRAVVLPQLRECPRLGAPRRALTQGSDDRGVRPSRASRDTNTTGRRGDTGRGPSCPSNRRAQRSTSGSKPGTPREPDGHDAGLSRRTAPHLDAADTRRPATASRNVGGTGT